MIGIRKYRRRFDLAWGTVLLGKKIINVQMRKFDVYEDKTYNECADLLGWNLEASHWRGKFIKIPPRWYGGVRRKPLSLIIVRIFRVLSWKRFNKNQNRRILIWNFAKTISYKIIHKRWTSSYYKRSWLFVLRRFFKLFSFIVLRLW